MKAYSFFSLSLFLIFTLIFSSCRKTDVKVRRKDNTVEFRLINKSADGGYYQIGHSDGPKSIEYNDKNISKTDSISYTIKLDKGDDYFFSVHPLSPNGNSFEMKVIVNERLYKEINSTSSVYNQSPLLISGKLETVKK